MKTAFFNAQPASYNREDAFLCQLILVRIPLWSVCNRLPSLIGVGADEGGNQESFEAFVNSALEIIRSNILTMHSVLQSWACSVDGVDDPEGNLWRE